MKKIFKTSSLILSIMFLVSAVVLVLFYCVGYGDMETVNAGTSSARTLVAPRFTNILMYWMYFLVGFCSLLIFAFGIVNGIKNRRSRKSGERRNSWVAPVFVFMILVLVASFFLASDAPIRTGSNVLFENVSMLKMVDVCLFTIYTLAASALLCTIVSMTGLLKSRK